MKCTSFVYYHGLLVYVSGYIKTTGEDMQGKAGPRLEIGRLFHKYYNVKKMKVEVVFIFWLWSIL